MSEYTGYTIIEILRATNLEKGIDDILWPEVVLVMRHIKNLRPTQALERLMSPAKMLDKNLSNLYHLRILVLTVYIFLHKEEQILKSAK